MIKKTLPIFHLILTLIFTITAHASEKPEIFVQLGHRGNVGSVVFSQDLF